MRSTYRVVISSILHSVLLVQTSYKRQVQEGIVSGRQAAS